MDARAASSRSPLCLRNRDTPAGFASTGSPATPSRASRGPVNPTTGRSPSSVPVRSNWTKGACADSGSPWKVSRRRSPTAAPNASTCTPGNPNAGSTNRRIRAGMADVHKLRPVIPALARPEDEERRHSLRDGPAAAQRRQAEPVEEIFMSRPGSRIGVSIGSAVGRSYMRRKREPGKGQERRHVGRNWVLRGEARNDRRRTVRLIQVGTDLNFANRPGTEGLGIIGWNQTGARALGLHLHAILAVSEAGLPLGAMGLGVKVPPTKRKQSNRRRIERRQGRRRRQCGGHPRGEPQDQGGRGLRSRARCVRGFRYAMRAGGASGSCPP